jgi:phosphatidylserine/phosphatidylglycerophosphate/cardiolipin synthase-like enzyme
MGQPILDPAEDAPPDPIINGRTIFARPDGITTVRLMHDAFDPTSKFLTNISTGNEVRYFLNGPDTFAAMRAAMATVTNDKHFIFMANWFVGLDFDFAGTTVETLLKAAAAVGAQVRGLFWRNIIMPAKPVTIAGKPILIIGSTVTGAINPHNEDEVKRINEYAGDCAAILDARCPVAGAHHQKLLIVNGSEGLIGFCGGIDLNPDRVDRVINGQLFKGLYDVHARVKGPGAFDLMNVFAERWKDHPDSAALDKKKDRRPLLSVAKPGNKGGATVQVARTYADLNDHPESTTLPGTPYSFAKDGKYENWLMYREAIKAAKKFIYIENQYFTSTELATVIARAIPRVAHVTIMLQVWSDLKDAFARTQKCIDIMRAAPDSATKLRIFAIGRAQNQYVHSKTVVIDDVLAITGSANTNRRGFACDSECSIGVTDHSREDKPAWTFAHRLRVRLWSHLLGMNNPDGHAALADGVESVIHWDGSQPGKLVEPYEDYAKDLKKDNPNDNPALTTFDTTWNSIFDPFPEPTKVVP